MQFFCISGFMWLGQAVSFKAMHLVKHCWDGLGCGCLRQFELPSSYSVDYNSPHRLHDSSPRMLGCPLNYDGSH